MLGFFMVSLSFAVAFAFHAVRGMYLHAERHVANAGGSNCKQRGIAQPCNGAQREWKGRAQRRAAQAKRGSLGRLLAGARGAAALLGGLSTASVRVSAPNFREGRCGYRPRMDGKRKTLCTWSGCSAGRAQHPSRKVWKRLPRLLTSVRLQATVIQVRIRNFIHKGLKSSTWTTPPKAFRPIR
jgi:hypothetical protein